VRSIVVGTAGHIDHGKSALVKALTGTDPDRLKEEQARGITIDLGFAHLPLGEVTIALVDVPGHERFVRNMLAGAGGIDAVILVVAADEGVKPQTREHFEICRLLGVDRGVIVLSKADLAEAGTLGLAETDARELVAGSFLEGAPIVPVSARTGFGLEALRAALGSLTGRPPRRARDGIVRYPIDRAFTVKGFGTVVTGTLVSGRVTEGAELVALPEGRSVRVRGLQVHGRPTREADAPARVAINVGAVETHQIGRGVTLASAGSLAVTRRADLKVSLIAGTRPLRHGARVRVHEGTSDVGGRVAICAVRPAATGVWRLAEPGEAAVSVPAAGEAYVRIRLEQPMAITRGDRVILRAFSPPATIGGGLVLDPEPPAGRLRRAAALARFDRLAAGPDFVSVWLTEAGLRGLTGADLVRRGGLDAGAAAAWLSGARSTSLAVAADRRFFDAAVAARVASDAVAELGRFHLAHPADAGMPREAVRERVAHGAPPALFDVVLASLVERGLVHGTDRLALASHTPAVDAADAAATASVLRQLRDAGLAPPEPGALAAAADVAARRVEALLQRLARDGRVLRLGTLFFHPEALTRLKADVLEMRRTGTVELDVAAFKARYGLSRKFAIPLLEWLDRERVTRRVGQTRRIL
jgi:selenocysteine-specific elongation factor